MNFESSYLVTSMRVFEIDGYIHSVMPFIRGKSLSDILSCSDGVAEQDVIHMGTRLAIAACDLHRQNILSTDIKPDNILINAIGHIKIIDLTCFERIGRQPEISLGTEPYAAPELTQRQTLSAATDIYSIGIVLYEAMIGTNTFIDQKLKPQLSNISGRFPKISRIISKAIDPNQQRRYQTARSLLNDLNRLKQTSSQLHEFSFRRTDGKRFTIPPGTFTLGRKDLAPQSLYMSEKQFEFDYDGTMAKIRDIANKNKAFLNNILVSNDWMKIQNPSQLKIADVSLKFNFK
jgi:serine/threonine protein kinase